MAQKQFTTFQADILSFELREAMLGIVRPGRVSGYDQIAADGTPSLGLIYLKVSHSAAGVQKLLNGQSALEDPIGVAITTQGTIIHEDQEIDIDIPWNVGSVYDRWYIVYMEHDYTDAAPGANNATYGFIAATFDDSSPNIPALTEPYHRVIVGYIRADPFANDINDLEYWPAESLSIYGDHKLGDMLFGDAAESSGYLNEKNEIGSNMGAIPSDGIVGNRRYSSGTYIATHESLSTSLRALDTELEVLNALDTVDGTRKLDDWATPDDNTDLNASAARHGLLPKLSGATDEFLRGDGTWDVPTGGRFVMRTGSFGNDIVLNEFSADNSELDFGGIAPGDADVLIIKCVWAMKTTFSAFADFQWRLRLAETTGGFTAEFHSWNTVDTGTDDVYRTQQVMVPCTNEQILFASISSAQKPELDYLNFTCVGWQTYS